MMFATTDMVEVRECCSKLLVTNGVRLEVMEDWKALTQ